MKKAKELALTSGKNILDAVKQPVIATLFGLLVGAIIILLFGYSPLEIYGEMFDKSFFTPYYLLQTLTRATPIVFCAVAIAMVFRAGIINIGVEGQMVVGGFVTAVAAIYIPGPPILVMVLSIILGMVAGGLYALIIAVLNQKLGVSIVIGTLMMNYVASYITSYFVTFPLKDTSGDGLALQTITIPEEMRIWNLVRGTTFNFSSILALLLVVLFLFYTKKTVLGYESKISGFNPDFAKYGGVNKNKVLLISMFLSGAIAALASSGEIFGIKYRFIDGMLSTPSYAWTGLMAALIANFNPIGILFISVLLAGLQVGGQAIQRAAGIPLEMALIIQCCITLFVSVKLTIRFFQRRKGINKLETEEATQ